MPKDFKNILLLTSEFPPAPGGIGNHGYNLAKQIASKYDLQVLSDIDAFDDDRLNEFAKSQSFSIRWIKRSAFVPFTYLKRVWLSVQLARKADIVIASGKFAIWQLYFIKKIFPSKKGIVVAHGTELDLKTDWQHQLIDKGILNADLVVSVSAYTARYLPAQQETKQLRVIIPNGIELAEFDNTNSKSFNSSEHSLRLITVGSLSERKGQLNVIATLPILKNDYPNLAYTMIGNPYIKDRIKAVAEKLDVAGIIEMTGPLDRRVLIERLSAATIFCMLSIHTSDGDFEGFGIAVLEANALGIPAVGSVNSGIADAIKDGYNGKLVDPQQPEAVAAAIAEILKDYDTYSSNALKWAGQHDWKMIFERYDNAIQAISTNNG
jgi:phosphatidyl-myo-inositol dimannoside synthase